MGFRQDKQQRRDWNRWLAEHRDELLLTGVPEEVFKDEARWFKLLKDGDAGHPAGWTVDIISDAESARLYRFLREHYRNADCQGLRWRLDARCPP